MIKLLNIVESILNSVRDMYEGFNEEELTEEYPEGFNWDEFKKLPNHSKRIKYAKEYLGRPIGKGSSRIVFRVDETKVLKLALNQKGIAQNAAETSWYGDSYYDDLLAQVIDFDKENDLWVEMELAFKPKKADFKRLFGVDITLLFPYLDNFYNENRGKRKYFHVDQETKEMLDENDNVTHLVDFMMSSDSLPADLTKLNSWGIVKRPYGDTIVLIDFGFTSEVYKSYYS